MRSHCSGLHGLSVLLYPCSLPSMEEISAGNSSIHQTHQFGRDIPRVPLPQVCIRCPPLGKRLMQSGENVTDLDEVCCSEFRRYTDNWRTLGGVFCGSFSLVGQQR